MEFQFRERLQFQPPHTHVLAAHHVPMAIGEGYKKYDPTAALQYIKNDGEMIVHQYKALQTVNAMLDTLDDADVERRFLDDIGTRPPITFLSKVVGCDVFPLQSPAAPLFKEEITPEFALIGGVDGLTRDGGVVKCDSYISRIWPTTRDQCEAVLLAYMAVYKCKWGVYYLPRANGMIYRLDFDESRWSVMRDRLRDWVTTYVTPN